MKGIWVLSIIGVVLSLFFALAGLASPGAPGEAAGAAFACACVIIPYVLARAINELGEKNPAIHLDVRRGADADPAPWAGLLQGDPIGAEVLADGNLRLRGYAGHLGIFSDPGSRKFALRLSNGERFQIVAQSISIDRFLVRARCLAI